MSSMFGGGNKAANAARADARKREQTANEEELRSRQRAERGAGGRGRDMLIGKLTSSLPQTLGGSR